MRCESGSGIKRGREGWRRGGEGGRWGGAAPVTASITTGSAHRSRGPRVPFGQRASPAPGAPVPTCSVLRPEPGSSSGRSERSPAPHPPAAPSPPRAYAAAAAAPALKRTKRNGKRMHAKKKKKNRKKQMRKTGWRARGSVGRGSRCSDAGDPAPGSWPARAAHSRLQLLGPPGARLAERPRPSPRAPLWLARPPASQLGGPGTCPASARGKCRERFCCREQSFSEEA